VENVETEEDASAAEKQEVEEDTSTSVEEVIAHSCPKANR